MLRASGYREKYCIAWRWTQNRYHRLVSTGLRLLAHCFYADAERFKDIDPVLKTIRHELGQIGVIERRKVVLRNPSDHTKLLTTSRTKLHSIEEIMRIESASLMEQLRCVVLADFIRKAELPKSHEENEEFDDIGVVPVFEKLRQAGIPDLSLGVLCGSLVIIPESSKELVIRAAAAIGIEQDDLILKAMPHAPGYLLVDITGGHHQGSVRLMTTVFEQSGITVLTGTKSLLGEGWDAPPINTLILASFVGSCVLSKQMRGRSIRDDPAYPAKTANVWHLVCVELPRRHKRSPVRRDCFNLFQADSRHQQSPLGGRVRKKKLGLAQAT